MGAQDWIAGLPVMGVLYCIRADWSQWRPLDFPGTHASSIQHNADVIGFTNIEHFHTGCKRAFVN